MKNQKQALLAAIASTIAAAVWLVNCILEATIGLTIRGAAATSISLTGVWTFSALCWWLMWHKERKTVQE